MRLLANALLVGAALLLAAPRTAIAQCPIESFGYSGGAVGLDRAIVAQAGGPAVAHFLEKGPDGWRTTQTLSIGDYTLFLMPTAAIDGSRAIAGCPEASSGAYELAGRAFVFDLVGGTWVPTELLSPTNQWADFFGTSVALDGDVAVVGASHSGPDGMGDLMPRAHVFELDSTGWRETAQITTYGKAIDVEGDTIVLGDPSDDPGRVYVHERVSGIWTWTAQLIAYASPNRAYFGSSVALDGDRLVVGAASSYQAAAGSVIVFRRVSGWWQQVQEIVPAQRDPRDHFGASVALSGSTLLVGAPGALGARGKVFRFEHDGTQFVERGSFDRGVREYDWFGTAVSFHGEDAFLGSEWSGRLYRLGFEHAVPYCPTTPNSTGAHGALDVEGCDSRSGAMLRLVASRLPPGVLARCFLGARSAQVPYGDGFRCVGAPLYRLPVGTTDASGVLATELDFADLGSRVLPGRTCCFQAFHRDRIGSGLNLTNALAIGITP